MKLEQHQPDCRSVHCDAPAVPAVPLSEQADILENELAHIDAALLPLLLTAHTTNPADNRIHWCCNDYEGHDPQAPIQVEDITGANGHVIMPRAQKDVEAQRQRSKSHAEVFTPVWVCKEQNDLIDNAWFGRERIFDTPLIKTSKILRPQIVDFPHGKTWKDYVCEQRMEFACGEAPYLTTRYDTTQINTDKAGPTTIPFEKRTGLLDRKLRLICEHCSKTVVWCHWAEIALMSIYGFDWQGDNVFLARENVFYAVLEAFHWRFPRSQTIKRFYRSFAEIISWNIWQMDALKGVIPDTCRSETNTLPGDASDEVLTPSPEPCAGCLTGDRMRHNGSVCYIKDWMPSERASGKAVKERILTFNQLVKEGGFNE